MSSLANVVVVGGGAAGVAALEALRREGFEGSLVLLGEEPLRPYDRPPLSKQVLTGAWHPERTQLREEQHYADLGVRIVHGRACGLDTGSRIVRVADGSELPYDGLVIATGVTPRRLPAGHELAGVHVLRGYEDALGVRAAFEGGGRVVVIGGGFLGLEAAASARALELDVTVVEPLGLPMLRQVGPDIAPHIAELHRARGVDLRLGVGVAELRGDGGRVTGVVLADGDVIAADCVLVAIGAAPDVAWLEDSGLALGDGIECDQFCRAAPGVYAAGDVASWVNPRYGRRMRLEHRTNASEMGAAAAYNLLHGDTRPFTPLPYFWTDQYDVKLQAHGVLGADAEVLVEQGAVADGRFVAVYRTDGRITGVLGWNGPALVLPYRRQMLAEPIAEPIAEPVEPVA